MSEYLWKTEEQTMYSWRVKEMVVSLADFQRMEKILVFSKKKKILRTYLRNCGKNTLEFLRTSFRSQGIVKNNLKFSRRENLGEFWKDLTRSCQKLDYQGYVKELKDFYWPLSNIFIIFKGFNNLTMSLRNSEFFKDIFERQMKCLWLANFYRFGFSRIYFRVGILQHF